MHTIQLLSPAPNEVLNTFQPLFLFQGTAAFCDIKFVLQVSDTPDFSGVVYEHSQVETPLPRQYLNHCNGSHGSTSFSDSSPSGHSITSFNNCYKDTAQKKYGTAAAFSANASPAPYLRTSVHNDFKFGLDPFTIDCWFRAKKNAVGAGYIRLYQHYSSTGGGYGIQVRTFYLAGAYRVQVLVWLAGALVVNLVSTDPALDIPEDSFGHVAVVRLDDASTTMKLFVNGVLADSAPANFNFDNDGYVLTCVSNNIFEMSEDEISVVKGTARWTDEFDPPFEYLDSALSVGTVSDWLRPSYGSTEPVYFSPPDNNVISPDGQYYWRVVAYPADYQDYLIAESAVHAFSILGATYLWKVGLEGSEVVFRPARNSVEIKTVQFGRAFVEKKIITVDFAHMNSTARGELYAEFTRRTVLKFQDNRGNVYDVYWGECDRSLDGTAHPPDKPVFGINQSSLIGGVQRWNGRAVFSEV